MIAPSWVRYPTAQGTRMGWRWTGTVPARDLLGATFWAQAARVACVSEGGMLDSVQCYDAGIFTAGPLGATALTGTLGSFLADIPGPTLAAHLGPLGEQHGLGFCAGERAFKIGFRTATADDLRRVFLGNGDQLVWKDADAQALQARAWVVAFASLLSDPIARRGIGIAAARLIREYLGSAGQPVFMPGGAFEVPRHMQRACACYLAFAINNPKGAARLLSIAGADADKMLDVASAPGPWPNVFASRVGRTRTALAAEAWT